MIQHFSSNENQSAETITKLIKDSQPNFECDFSELQDKAEQQTSEKACKQELERIVDNSLASDVTLPIGWASLFETAVAPRSVTDRNQLIIKFRTLLRNSGKSPQ